MSHSRLAVCLHLTPLFCSGLFAQQWSQIEATAQYSELAHDVKRARTLRVLNGQHSEWDGVAWRRLGPAFGDSVSRVALAYDRIRERTVAVHQHLIPGLRNETWLHDGVSWSRSAAQPPALRDVTLVYDAAGRGVLMIGTEVAPAAHLETWLFDGAAWSLRAATGPPVRQGAAFASDLARARVVSFGGAVNNADGNQTWEWDGTAWTLLAPAVSPLHRRSAALAYDELRQRVVLFGGGVGPGVGPGSSNFRDTWEWDGSVWRQLQAVAAPARRSHKMVFDRASGQVQAWFGIDEEPTVLRDGWGLDGTTWRQVHVPSPVLICMATDTARGRLVALDWQGRTSLWDGIDWREVGTGLRPPARSVPGFAFDPLRNNSVLFGGQAAVTISGLGDTWVFDGSTWTLATAGPQPPARAFPAFGFHAGSGGIVMFSGTDFTTNFTDTWLWNGSQWRDLTAAAGTPPPPRLGASMAMHSSGELVLHGGSLGGVALLDTWLWNGAWQQAVNGTLTGTASAIVTTDPRTGRALLIRSAGASETLAWDGSRWQPLVSGGPVVDFVALDPLRQRLVALAQSGAGWWTLTPTPHAVLTYGAGCGLPAPQLMESGRPRIGERSFGLRLVGLPPAALALLAFGTQAQIALPGGCTQLVANPQVGSVVLASATGVASFGIAVPPAPALRGLGLQAQAAGLVPFGPFVGSALSNGITLIVGD